MTRSHASQIIAALVVSCVFVVDIPLRAAAYLSPKNYQSNQTGEYIDARAKPPAACDTSSASGGASAITGDQSNIKAAFLQLVGFGLTNIQAAAIIGNLMVEAPGPPLVNPDQNQGGGGPGRGIAQWSVGGRWKLVVAYAGNEQVARSSLSTQVNFLWKEFHDQNYNKSWDKFAAAATSPGGAATSQSTGIGRYAVTFRENYEQANPADAHDDKRIGNANAVMLNDWAQSAKPTAAIANAPAGANTSTASDGCASGGTVVEIAKAELAKKVMENPIGCDADNHSISGSCGIEVDKYTDSHLEYWCADFTSWVFKAANTPFTGGASGGWRIASVDSLQKWFDKNARYFDNGPLANPQPGDVFFRGTVHTGIVVSVQGSDLHIISGNTSVANFSNGVGVGEGVIQNFRSSSITGFGSLTK